MKLTELKKPRRILDTEDLPKVMRNTKDVFVNGQCCAFASALHSLIGGDFYCLYDKGSAGDVDDKPLHVYIRLNHQNYDVMGKRSSGTMALDFTGRVSGMTARKIEGSVVPGLTKPTEKYILLAKAYILANPDKFDVPEKLRLQK